MLQLITKEKAKVIIAFKISCSIFFDLTKQPERENFLKKEDRVMVLIFFLQKKQSSQNPTLSWMSNRGMTRPTWPKLNALSEISKLTDYCGEQVNQTC